MKKLDLATFDADLFQAVEAAEVGFHFEEGGCWGFAHALYSRLKTLGYAPSLAFRPEGFIHAWVRLDDIDLDYRGRFEATPGFVVLKDLRALQEAAASAGNQDACDYDADVALAHQVLDSVFATTDLAAA